MTRAVPALAFSFVEQGEAKILRVYDDARPKREMRPGDHFLGTPTAGVGHTGADLHPGLIVTEAMADAWLRDDLADAAAKIGRVVKPEVIEALTVNQYAALISFVFNVGCNAKWTIWKVLNARQFDAVPAQLMRFTKGKVKGQTVEIAGLVNRRAAEVALWKTPELTTARAILAAAPIPAPSSSVTRHMETPPDPAPVKPLSQSKSFITVAGSGIASATVAANEISKAVAPYADRSETVARLVAILATVAALLTAAGLAFLWLKNKRAGAL